MTDLYTTQPRWYAGLVMKLALAEVGVKEVPLGSNRGPRVDDYIRAAGLNPAKGSYPWCMGFVRWAHEMAALELGGHTTCPKTARVSRAWQRSQLSWVDGTVLPGDVFFRGTDRAGAEDMLRGGNPNGHCGIVVSVAPGLILTTAEGNTNAMGSREGHQVAQRELDVADPRLVGFARYGLA